jgi:hypothetical protein
MERERIGFVLHEHTAPSQLGTESLFDELLPSSAGVSGLLHDLLCHMKTFQPMVPDQVGHCVADTRPQILHGTPGNDGRRGALGQFSEPEADRPSQLRGVAIANDLRQRSIKIEGKQRRNRQECL